MKKKILGLVLFMLLVLPFTVFADEYDDYYQKITDDGKIHLDCIKPSNYDLSEGLLTYGFEKYSNDEFFVYGYLSDSSDTTLTKAKMQIKSLDQSGSKTFDVEIIYNGYDKNIYDRISKYQKKFPTEGTIESRLFRMDDLEIINYIYNGGYNGTYSRDIANSVINYSSEFNKILENSNVKAKLDLRAGWDEDFTNGGFGYLILTHNGFAYNIVEEAGVKGNKVLYIPSNTENTRESFISAAKKRVKEYLSKDIEITYGGQINDIDPATWDMLPIEEVVNIDNTIGEYYIFNINGDDYKFFIEKNDNKMKNAVLNTKDLSTGSQIITDSPEVPLDSKIQYNGLDKNSEEYKELIKKLNLDFGFGADIKLFSSSQNKYITKLSNGKFKVYIPLNDENLENLKAYYVKDNGEVETYDVTIENGFATFETTHFSTYMLGITSDSNTSQEIVNPNTFDNINIYGRLLFISVIGTIIVMKCLKEQNN